MVSSSMLPLHGADVSGVSRTSYPFPTACVLDYLYDTRVSGPHLRRLYSPTSSGFNFAFDDEDDQDESVLPESIPTVMNGEQVRVGNALVEVDNDPGHLSASPPPSPWTLLNRSDQGVALHSCSQKQATSVAARFGSCCLAASGVAILKHL